MKMLWAVAALLGTPVAMASDGLVSAAAITISIQRGPTPPRELPLEATADGSVRLHASWTLGIDASGHVSKLEPSGSPLVDNVRAPVESAIRRWQFIPGTIAGQPAATDTTLAIDLTLVPMDADKLAVRIDDARTGVDIPRRGMHAFPKYPFEAIRHRKEAMVVLKVDYDAEGRVLAANLQDGAPEVDASFARSAQQAVKRWTFAPEIVGGRALAGSAIVPICFEMYLDHDPKTNRSCQWKPPAGHQGVGEGGIVAIEPAARLQSEVIGRTL